IVSAPALSVDDTNNLWVYFGTGRFYSSLDQSDSDTKHFFGVKDCNLTGRCTTGAVEQHDLFDASNVVICKTCNTSDHSKIVSLDGGATYDRGFDAGADSLLNTVGAKSGWFITLPETRERNLTTAAVIGGTLVFTTFFPGTDVCVSEAQGRLYALYYKTGTPYKESAIGAGDSGIANKFINLGAGVPSGVTIHMNKGENNTTALIQFTTGGVGETPLKTSPVWSRMVAWRDV
ncbi:MAG TPA: hypothetical protein VI337_02515, partial [Nitrospirales bacterium]|nr:hypothetical protein [Nitrospirales bacterium]